MSDCIKGKAHDFESNEFSNYCANGCGETWSNYTIKQLGARVKELEEREKKLIELLEERLVQDDHTDGCGYVYDPDNYPCHCMDKSYFNHDAWSDRVNKVLKELGIKDKE